VKRILEGSWPRPS